MIIFGFLLQLIGFIFCLTVIGAVIGVPLIIIGGIMVLFGFFGRRKTVITNVVHVQNSPTPTVQPQPAAAPNRVAPAIEPPQATAELPGPAPTQVVGEPPIS